MSCAARCLSVQMMNNRILELILDRPDVCQQCILITRDEFPDAHSQVECISSAFKKIFPHKFNSGVTMVDDDETGLATTKQ